MVARILLVTLGSGLILGVPFVLAVNALQPSRAVVIIAYCIFVVVALLPGLYVEDRKHGRLQRPST